MRWYVTYVRVSRPVSLTPLAAEMLSENDPISGVGRAIHEAPEVPNVYDRRQREVLSEGLVLTIEPMITAGSSYPIQSADGWTLRTRDGSLAAHCEHTLVITQARP
jgi:methionyl aminopeptidase